jgi:hypothetical protein
MKLRARADITTLNQSVLKLLTQAEDVEGVRPVGFFPDLAGTTRGPNGVLWLIYEYDDDASFTRLHDLLVKGTNGAISLKSAGGRLEPGDEGYKGHP